MFRILQLLIDGVAISMYVSRSGCACVRMIYLESPIVPTLESCH